MKKNEDIKYSCKIKDLKSYSFKLKDIYKSIVQELKIKIINNGSEKLPPTFWFKNKKDNIIRFQEKELMLPKGVGVSKYIIINLLLMFPNDIETGNYCVVGELYLDNIGPYDGFTFLIEIKNKEKIEKLLPAKEKFILENIYNHFFHNQNLISNGKEFDLTKTIKRNNSIGPKNVEYQTTNSFFSIEVSSNKDDNININHPIKQINDNNSINEYQNKIKKLNEIIENLTNENKKLKKEFVKVAKEKALIKKGQSNPTSHNTSNKFNSSIIKDVHVYDMLINPIKNENKSKELFISKEIEINVSHNCLDLSNISSHSSKSDIENQKELKRCNTTFFKNKISEQKIKEIINDLDHTYNVTSLFDLKEIKKAIIDAEGDYQKIQELLFR